MQEPSTLPLWLKWKNQLFFNFINQITTPRNLQIIAICSFNRIIWLRHSLATNSPLHCPELMLKIFCSVTDTGQFRIKPPHRAGHSLRSFNLCPGGRHTINSGRYHKARTQHLMKRPIWPWNARQIEINSKIHNIFDSPPTKLNFNPAKDQIQTLSSSWH